MGRCEVVVYTPAHTGSLATLTEEERLLLAWAWRDRYEALYALPGVRFVMPFENRGEAVGVTLHHPHGQIYAYPFVPPVLERESQAFRERPVLLRLFPSLGPYVVDEEEGFLAFVPPSPATPLRSGWPPWKGTPVPGPSPRGRWRPSPGSWAGWWPGTTPSLGSPSLTSWSSTPRPWGRRPPFTSTWSSTPEAHPGQAQIPGGDGARGGDVRGGRPARGDREGP